MILPTTAPLVGMLMLGNLFRECGVVRQLADTASNALMYTVVILLGTSVGATTSAEAFLNMDTIKIVVLGLIASRWHGCRRSVRKTDVHRFRRQGQPVDRFCRRIRRSDGRPGFPEGGRSGGSYELPADACDGP